MQPQVSFSTLAKMMGAMTPVAAASTLRGHKYPTLGPKLSYRNARQQLIDYAVAQKPFSPHSGLRQHELDAVQALQQFGVQLPAGCTFSRPPTHAPHWLFNGVEISVFPDVNSVGPNGLGAFKAYFGKEKLARGVGATMAALLHHYKTQVLGLQNVYPQHCLVYEVRQGARFQCGNSTRLLSNAQAACQMIAALWPTL